MTVLLTFCRNQDSLRPANSTTFKYVDKETGDTCKFFGYNDLDTAIFYAKKLRKDILIIFSGWAMEQKPQWRTLAAFEDNDKIQENFIIARLPVDDKRLAKDTTKVVIWNGQEHRLRTIGNRYSWFQNEVFKSLSQPFLCFVDTMTEPYGQTLSYETNKEKVTSFINSGLTK